jgi:uncharacterized protein (TIGR02996 family)
VGEVSEDDALFRAVLAAPADTDARRVYADWLDDHDRPGGAYLRAEADAAGGAAARRGELLKLFLKLPAAVRHRVTQPDFLLAPPAPFRTAWYEQYGRKPKPYRSMSNLPREAFSPRLPWLRPETELRADQKQFERDETKSLAEARKVAAHLGLKWPPGFEALAQDFPRRNALGVSMYEFYLSDATLEPLPRVGDGHVILFYADMNYGANPQLSWGLYLVPKVAWHCVVAFELFADDGPMYPTDPKQYRYVAPSFQTFLYRWMHDAQ